MTLRDEAAHYAEQTLSPSNREWYQRVVNALDAAQWAQTRLENYADKDWAGEVQGGGREWKRKIWAAFADFNAALGKAG